MNHHVCINTTASCLSEKFCFLHCCAEERCNEYEKGNDLSKILTSYVSLVKPTTKTVTNPTNGLESTLKSKSKPKSPLSLASFVKCSKCLIISLIIIILLNYKNMP